MPIIDVSAEGDARAAAESWMRADLARPFDLARGPLFGYALLKAAVDRYFFYARYHHIVIDGFGCSLVARRLAEVYTALSPDATSARVPLGASRICSKRMPITARLMCSRAIANFGWTTWRTNPSLSVLAEDFPQIRQSPATFCVRAPICSNQA